MNLKNRIFHNIKNYKKPIEKEYTQTQLKAFEILNKEKKSSDEIKLQKVYQILARKRNGKRKLQ